MVLHQNQLVVKTYVDILIVLYRDIINIFN